MKKLETMDISKNINKLSWKFGSNIEKAFYRHMTIPELIDRILKKRAVTFVGPHDRYLLLSGETHAEGWEQIGTPNQHPPLVLENCLSYDEMKLSSFVAVSGWTECINEGSRYNKAEPKKEGVCEQAVIIGIVGPRFKRKNRMEYEDILITIDQNIAENGYGNSTIITSNTNKDYQSAINWRNMWEEFYQVKGYTYEELTSEVNIKDATAEKRYLDRYIKIPTTTKSNDIFDNEVYYKRLSITAETVLIEANQRAMETKTFAFINVIGAAQFKLARSLDGSLPPARRIFLENTKHPKGGINVQLMDREPSAALIGEHANKLLVITYPWDGNAHPGNEFWRGNLTVSGDPAAACSTQVAELHNAHINPFVTGTNTRVVAANGAKILADYCDGFNK